MRHLLDKVVIDDSGFDGFFFLLRLALDLQPLGDLRVHRLFKLLNIIIID